MKMETLHPGEAPARFGAPGLGLRQFYGWWWDITWPTRHPCICHTLRTAVVQGQDPFGQPISGMDSVLLGAVIQVILVPIDENMSPVCKRSLRNGSRCLSTRPDITESESIALTSSNC
jgi:hypothetical protein